VCESVGQHQPMRQGNVGDLGTRYLLILDNLGLSMLYMMYSLALPLYLPIDSCEPSNDTAKYGWLWLLHIGITR